MAQAKPTQLQDQFLNKLRKDKIPITAFLMNGVPLKGKIVSFDSFVVLFDVDGRQHLVFKHAISTIQPSKPIDIKMESDVSEA